MSEQKYPEEIRPEDMTLDELIQSTKEDIQGDRSAFQPTLPAEYADLVSDEDLDELEEEAEDTHRIPPVIRALLYVCCVLAASILLAVLAWKCADDVCALTATDNVVTVTVPANATMSQITNMLHEEGLMKYPWLFNLYCMVSKAEEKIIPGTYELNNVFDYHALVNGMSGYGGSRATVEVTIPEGYEAEDIFALLAEKGVCSVEELKDAAANYEFDYWFLEGLEYGDYRRLEGYLFPDTYEFYVDDEPENALGRFLRNFNNKLDETLQADLDTLNRELRSRMLENGFTEAEAGQKQLTMHDVIIVASLVEKETSGAAESGKIASVIYNRLCSKLYPCLNIDATIQYVLPERKEILSNADKAVISPYNTYTNAGLPVGPIASPGMSSIRAALYPSDTDYYFYALNPAGGHSFFETVYEYQAFLDSLLGEGEQGITEEKAIEIALEEAKKELYQYQPWESDFSEGAYAQKLSSKDDWLAFPWSEEWAVKDADGEPLYTDQPVWAVRLTDRNDPLTSLLIYVDAETGDVVGAGQLSD